MKNSFYGHFVAGETQEEIRSYLSLMKSYGVGAILDYAVEADIPQSKITERFEYHIDLSLLLLLILFYLVKKVL